MQAPVVWRLALMLKPGAHQRGQAAGGAGLVAQGM